MPVKKCLVKVMGCEKKAGRAVAKTTEIETDWKYRIKKGLSFCMFSNLNYTIIDNPVSETANPPVNRYHIPKKYNIFRVRFALRALYI